MMAVKERNITSTVLERKGRFPNNPQVPLLIYHECLDFESPEEIQELFEKNHWFRSWVNGIYSFHHFHSNTHEVLAIFSGEGSVQFGGEEGPIFSIKKGDVVFIPAGVSHKSLQLSKDFLCVGSYPFDVEYDMNYGDVPPELLEKRIKKVPFPKSDPIFGLGGPLFFYLGMEDHVSKRV